MEQSRNEATTVSSTHGGITKVASQIAINLNKLKKSRLFNWRTSQTNERKNIKANTSAETDVIRSVSSSRILHSLNQLKSQGKLKTSSRGKINFSRFSYLRF